jgi:hypothetical protein
VAIFSNSDGGKQRVSGIVRSIFATAGALNITGEATRSTPCASNALTTTSAVPRSRSRKRPSLYSMLYEPSPAVCAVPSGSSLRRSRSTAVTATAAAG